MIKDGIPELINKRDSLEEDNRKLKTSIRNWRITSCVLLGLLIVSMVVGL